MATKTRSVVITEGALYVIIASGASFISLLESDAPLTERSIIAASVASLVAGATALKAFLSQAYIPQNNEKIGGR